MHVWEESVRSRPQLILKIFSIACHYLAFLDDSDNLMHDIPLVFGFANYSVFQEYFRRQIRRIRCSHLLCCCCVILDARCVMLNTVLFFQNFCHFFHFGKRVTTAKMFNFGKRITIVKMSFGGSNPPRKQKLCGKWLNWISNSWFVVTVNGFQRPISHRAYYSVTHA